MQQNRLQGRSWYVYRQQHCEVGVDWAEVCLQAEVEQVKNDTRLCRFTLPNKQLITAQEEGVSFRLKFASLEL